MFMVYFLIKFQMPSSSSYFHQIESKRKFSHGRHVVILCSTKMISSKVAHFLEELLPYVIYEP
jgi:hypothetical protein